MNLDKARELREELAAIEATLLRIRDLWRSADLPSVDNLRGLAQQVQGIASGMENITRTFEELPGADDLDSLGQVVIEVSAAMQDIVATAKELPSAKDVR